MQRQLLKYYKSEKYWLLYRLWKVICYTVNISLMHMPYQNILPVFLIIFSFFSIYIKVMRTELFLKKKSHNKILTHNVLTELLQFKNKKKNKDSTVVEGTVNVSSIKDRLWRLLTFLTKWFPKSWKLCNCPLIFNNSSVFGKRL